MEISGFRILSVEKTIILEKLDLSEIITEYPIILEFSFSFLSYLFLKL